MKTIIPFQSHTVGLAALCVTLLLANATHAAVIVNGGFESGFAGWTLGNQLGSDGTFHLQSGTTSPVIGDPVPAPPEGTTAAMSDAEGPGAHVLYQIFTPTAPIPSAVLSFDLFVGNRAEEFFTPETLDFATPELNQQARVDILLGSADPFSVAPADVLLEIFQTVAGDPAVSGYTRHAVDVTTLLNDHLDQPLMLRFAETDNVFVFQLGVDNVSIAPPARTVPDTSSAAMGFLVWAGLCWAGRRSARARNERRLARAGTKPQAVNLPCF